MEVIYSTDYEWNILNSVTGSGETFANQNSHTYPLSTVDDPFNYAPPQVTVGFTPTINWDSLLPSVPTNLRATATSETSVTIKWATGADTRPTWYWIYRQDTDANPNGDFIQVGTATPITTGTGANARTRNASSFVDTIPNASGNRKYTYKIKPVEGNPGIIGEFSDPVSVTTLTSSQVYLNTLYTKVQSGTLHSLYLEQ
ncbi:hypothetical protein CCP3SC15_550004 [Gammaproteobacteria bacterium]